MALGSNHATGSGGTADVFVPEIWAKEAQLATENRLVAFPLFRDLSSLAKEMGGDILRLPTIGNLSPTSRSAVTISQITPTINTETSLTMNINNRYVLSIAIDDAAKWQTNAAFNLDQYKQKVIYGMKKQMDSSITSQYASLTPTAVGTLGTAPTDDDILECIVNLDSADAPGEDRYFIMGPKTKKDLLKNNKFVNTDFIGMDKLPVQSGLVGELYGLVLYQSNNIPTSGGNEVNFLGHKDAYAKAVQKDLFVEYSREATWTADVYVAQALWGVMVYRATFGTALYGR